MDGKRRDAVWLAAAVVGIGAFTAGVKISQHAAPPPVATTLGEPPNSLAFTVEDRTPPSAAPVEVAAPVSIVVTLRSGNVARRVELLPANWPKFKDYVLEAEHRADQASNSVTATSDGQFIADQPPRVGIDVEYSHDYLQFAWTNASPPDNLLVRVDRSQWALLNQQLAAMDVALDRF